MINRIKIELQKLLHNLTGEDFDKVWSEAELKISQPEVGGKVEVIAEDGTLSDAPDGEYTMDNGFQFTVKDGQIASIVGEEPAEEATEEDAPAEEPSVEAAEEESAPVEEPAAEETPEPNAEVEELKSKVSDLEAQVADLAKMIEDMKSTTEVAATKEDVAAFTAQVAELNTTIKVLAKVPVEFSKTSKNNIVKDSKDQKMMDLARIINHVRK